MIRWMLPTVLMISPAMSAHAQGSKDPNLSGKWSLSILTASGPEQRTFDLKQATDGSISGTVGSPYGDITISKGRATRDSLALEFSMAGGQIKVEYHAAIRSDTLRGIWKQTNEPVRPFIGVRGTTRVELPPEMTKRGV